MQQQTHILSSLFAAKCGLQQHIISGRTRAQQRVLNKFRCNILSVIWRALLPLHKLQKGQFVFFRSHSEGGNAWGSRTFIRHALRTWWLGHQMRRRFFVSLWYHHAGWTLGAVDPRTSAFAPFLVGHRNWQAITVVLVVRHRVTVVRRYDIWETPTLSCIRRQGRHHWVRESVINQPGGIARAIRRKRRT